MVTITEKPVRLRGNYFLYRVPSSQKSSNGPNVIREIVLDRTLKKHGLDFKQSLYFFRYSEKQKRPDFYLHTDILFFQTSQELDRLLEITGLFCQVIRAIIYLQRSGAFCDVSST